MRLQRNTKEDGELLMENHQLNTQLEDNSTIHCNKSNKCIQDAVIIQRAWRAYKYRQNQQCNIQNDQQHSNGGSLSETELSETESMNQAMSVSTPDESVKNLNPEDDIQSDFDSTGNALETEAMLENDANNNKSDIGDCDDDSIPSDYSELHEQLKHSLSEGSLHNLYNNDLDDNFANDQSSADESEVSQGPTETDEQFAKRMRKINYLSLAQEFAALKKAQPDALPFDAHKKAKGYRDSSPVSDVSSDAESDHNLSMEKTKKQHNINISSMSKLSHETRGVQKPAVICNDNKDSVIYDYTISNKTANNSCKNSVSVSYSPNRSSKKTCERGQGTNPPSNNKNLAECSPKKESKMSSPELLGEFDVYTIETTLPTMDWAALEAHLANAAKEEEIMRKARKNEREEIRRKLAMGSDNDEYYGGERITKKPNLQTRLQSGMNLQICFMNETGSDQESSNGESEHDDSRLQPPTNYSSSLRNNKQSHLHTKIKDKPYTLLQHQDDDDGEMDFLAKQAKLQAEARLALAQAKEMAHMQMEVEKQMKKKSPIAEMVGIPFPDGRKRLSRVILSDMNVAQLQVIVNDLHSQIESLNEELVKFLLARDDLHMEQDSMLVDIEDLTRRAKDQAERWHQREALKGKK